MTIAVLIVILASGVLKGFDPLLNLVLDGTTEHLRGTCQYCVYYIFTGFILVHLPEIKQEN